MTKRPSRQMVSLDSDMKSYIKKKSKKEKISESEAVRRCIVICMGLDFLKDLTED